MFFPYFLVKFLVRIWAHLWWTCGWIRLNNISYWKTFSEIYACSTHGARVPWGYLVRNLVAWKSKILNRIAMSRRDDRLGEWGDLVSRNCRITSYFGLYPILFASYSFLNSWFFRLRLLNLKSMVKTFCWLLKIRKLLVIVVVDSAAKVLRKPIGLVFILIILISPTRNSEVEISDLSPLPAPINPGHSTICNRGDAYDGWGDSIAKQASLLWANLLSSYSFFRF